MPNAPARAAAAVLLSLVLAAPAAPDDGPAAAPAASSRSLHEVIKDAKPVPGFLAVYRTDEKTWLAIAPSQLDRPFLFSYAVQRSIGERGLYGGMMGDAFLAVLHRSGNQLQLVARNTRFFAEPGTPQARFVEESFSDSLLASAPLASRPDGATGTLLVDAGALLGGDIPGYLTALEETFRLPFALDARNTAVERVRNAKDATGILVRAHYGLTKLPPAPAAPPATPPPPLPSTVPDPRSLFAGFYYSFAALPEVPMAPRLADERIGHFVTSRADHTLDAAPNPAARYVQRWRLEKQDPAAALSPPRAPITFWLDRSVPERYRSSVTGGILAWNGAFEAIGFRDAIAVRQQVDGDDFDTLGARHASIRWFTGVDAGFAIGPSTVDPRSGEILDADIAFSDALVRRVRRIAAEDLGRATGFGAGPGAWGPRQQGIFLACRYGAEKVGELGFAVDLLAARGLDPGGPEVERLVQDFVREITMHEVGHALGLRHNFRSSTIYRPEQLGDPAFTKDHGLGGSVMDYLPMNLPLEGEPPRELQMTTIGPYDRLAVEYAYRPLAPAGEKAELARIAARTTTDPLLAYATDEDAGWPGPPELLSIDPEVNRGDLGSDPIAWYRRRLQLTRELWSALEKTELPPGESYERLTRSVASGFEQLARVAPLLAKYVGGVRHVRDRAGTGRPLYEPTPAARQREALDVIAGGLFAPGSFRLAPGLVSRLALDHFERGPNPDVSIAAAVLRVQRAALDQLLSEEVAQRLLDSQDKLADPARAFPLSELYDSLRAAIWAELAKGRDIPPMRRNLQREHLRRIATVLTRPDPRTPPDARSLQREVARQLSAELRAALPRLASKEARAHAAESLETLTEALRAPLQRSGP